MREDGNLRIISCQEGRDQRLVKFPADLSYGTQS
jgi:hypothetical protein